MKWQAALLALVLLAGCTGNGGPTGTGDEGKTDTGDGDKGTPATGGVLEIGLEDFPTEISLGTTEYFKIKAGASEGIDSVEVLLYNLGSHLKSSCEGRNRIGDLEGGSSQEISCSLEAVGSPVEDTSHDVMFEATYKVQEYSGQVNFKVYDEEEYERVSPAGGSDSAGLGVGDFYVRPANVKEGEDVTLELNLGGGMAKGKSCNCNVEKVIIQVPRGFSVSGGGDWSMRSCGNFNCYQKAELNTPATERLTLTTPGVIKTDTFYVGVEVQGAWKSEDGYGTVTIRGG